MAAIHEYSTEVQRVDVKKRFEGLKKSSEGVQGFDVVPIILVGVLLMAAGIGIWVLQRRRRRARLEEDRQNRREDEKRRRKRLEEAAKRQQRFTVTESKGHALADVCPVTDILRIRDGASASLVGKEPGHTSGRVQVLGTSPQGLSLIPHPEESGHVPDGDVWLSVRQSGGPRLYPVHVTRQPSAEHHDALVASTAGPGWKFSRFGRCATDLHAIAIPALRSIPNEEDAVPVRIVSLGIGSAELDGPIEMEGGATAVLRVALPDEMESTELAARVRTRSRDEAGRDITEVAFDSVPGPTLDILTRALARLLTHSLDPEPVPTDP